MQENPCLINNENVIIKNLFNEILKLGNIFKNRDILKSSYVPEFLPHRDKEIKALAVMLRPALNFETPFNILISGKPGTGKTAVTRLISRLFSEKSKIIFVYQNAQIIDTQYRVLQNIAENLNEKLPFTGLPTDEVYKKTIKIIDKNKCNLILIIDEADKLKNDGVLYTLSRINENLQYSKVSLILIANDMHFIDFYDARIKSSLNLEYLLFRPYDANELIDILQSRATMALQPNVLEKDVIPLCSALAAQEHGDARKALDLFLMSAELAERTKSNKITTKHVILAHNKLEDDRLKEVVNNLPSQMKIVLYSILKIDIKNKKKKVNGRITTGEVYNMYDILSKKIGIKVLTQRRVADLISELESIGIISTRVISKGRGGRTRDISVTSSKKEIMSILQKDDIINNFSNLTIKDQARLF